MSSESIDPEDVESYDDANDRHERDRDGVGSLHDAEAEQGDEAEVTDAFDIDNDEARELGGNLDRLGGETPELD
jgi:hypothetical protein